jgi:hypothetical protein
MMGQIAHKAQRLAIGVDVAAQQLAQVGERLVEIDARLTLVLIRPQETDQRAALHRSA